MKSICAARVFGGICLLVVVMCLGCEQKLPGGLECEKMAYRALGRTSHEAVHSPKLKRITDRLIHGCLTIPFDQAAVACTQSGRGLVPCAEELARRSPERNSSLRELIQDLRTLGSI